MEEISHVGTSTYHYLRGAGWGREAKEAEESQIDDSGHRARKKWHSPNQNGVNESSLSIKNPNMLGMPF